MLRRQLLNRRFISSEANFKKLSAKIKDHIGSNTSIEKLNHNLLVNYWKLYPKITCSERSTLLNDQNSSYFIQTAKRLKRKSSLVCGLYRRELIYNSHSNTKLCSEVIQKLEDNAIMVTEPRDILTYCIKDSIESKDILIAIDLLNTYYKLFPNEDININLINEVITLVPKCDPRLHYGCIKGLVSLGKILKRRKASINIHYQTTLSLCSMALEINPPGLGVQLCRSLLDEKTFIHSNEQTSSKVLEKIIILGDKQNVPPIVCLNWLKLRRSISDITKIDPLITERVMKSCQKSENFKFIATEIIKDCTPEFYCNNKYLLSEIIKFTVENGDFHEVQNLMNQIEVHLDSQHYNSIWLSLECQSALLRMYLKFKDSEGIDKTMKTIIQSHKSLTPNNNKLITEYLLDDLSIKSLERAITFCDTLTGQHYLAATNMIVGKLVQEYNKSKVSISAGNIVSRFLQDAYKIDKSFENELWDSVAYLYISSLLKPINNKKSAKLNLRLSKHIYLKSIIPDLKSSDICSNPFLLTDPNKIIIKVSEKNRYNILKLIGSVAYTYNDREIFKWGLHEMSKLGMSWQEFLIDWKTTVDHSYLSDTGPNKTDVLELGSQINNEKLKKLLV